MDIFFCRKKASNLKTDSTIDPVSNPAISLATKEVTHKEVSALLVIVPAIITVVDVVTSLTIVAILVISYHASPIAILDSVCHPRIFPASN